MNRALVLALAAMTALPARGAFDTRNWQWEAPLTAPGSAGPGLTRVEIPPWVFDRSEASLRDLRVLNEHDVLTPHVILWRQPRSQMTPQWRPARLINQTWQPNQYARAVADFRESFEKNEIRIETSGENFQRRVTIEGGTNNSDWETIENRLYVADISRNDQRYKANVLKVPDNNFRYLRLTVHHMPNDPGRIDIVSVHAANVATQWDDLTTVALAGATVRPDARSRETLVLLDNGYRHLPIDTIRIHVSDAEFRRACAVEGRNALTVRSRRDTETGWDETEQEAPWQPVLHTVLYRIADAEYPAESLALRNLAAPYRFLRLRIYDGDLSPLALTADGIQVFRHRADLAFQHSPAHTYRLIGGNALAGTPEYELTKNASNVARSDLPVGALGEARPLQPGDGPSWVQSRPTVITLAVIAGLAAGAGLWSVGRRRSRRRPALPARLRQ